jgi:hypothetical protein
MRLHANARLSLKGRAIDSVESAGWSLTQDADHNDRALLDGPALTPLSWSSPIAARRLGDRSRERRKDLGDFARLVAGSGRPVVLGAQCSVARRCLGISFLGSMKGISTTTASRRSPSTSTSSSVPSSASSTGTMA